MGWFEQQIEQRRDLDQQLFEDSFFRAAGAILGERSAEKISDERIITAQAIDEILKYYHFKPIEIPLSLNTHEEQLDYCLRPHGLMKRRIILEEGWYKDAYGPVMAYFKETGQPAALLPDQISGYYYKDKASGKRVKITRKVMEQFDTEALCFYRPLPMRKIGIPDLLLYMKRCISVSDAVTIVIATLAVTLVGMIMTKLTAAITGPVLLSGKKAMLISVAVCFLCVAVSSQLISSIKGLLMNRISGKTSVAIEASMMMRILSLPASFFRKYSAGELNSRSSSVGQLCNLMLDLVLSTGLGSLVSLIYITQIFSFAPALVVPSLLIILVTVVFGAVSSLVQMKITKKLLELGAKESGMTYAMISGVQKIKLAGAEKRVFARWLNTYSREAELNYNPPTFIKINGVIATSITLISNIIIYFIAVESNVTQSDYFGFTAAFGAVMGAFSALSGMALSIASIRPILEMAEPFLKAEPEVSDGREIVTRLSGSVELSNVTFRYSENMPYIVKDLSLKIKSGEYVAIVGRTGCGKSTLMRLLLGFEKPERGAVYYDGKNINRLDLGSLRRKIGSVMQSGGLFQGDIYSNIVITAPDLTLDQAWEAAEIAGIADDIRDMPMGMHTVISEGQGGVSGGQRQRLMIARAVAPKPSILIFDEATSALDNKTQKQVSDALDKMGCTRIVIAHRLSTIRHCDRILVLEGGAIVEDGTYDELIEKNGRFAELVKRQRIDEE